MKSLYIAIQDSESRTWSPVARIRKSQGLYHLNYTGGAKDVPGFKGFGRMHGLDREFISKDIFPLLKNRLLGSNRPEHKNYLEWLGLHAHNYDAFEELARTGGLRGTDDLELIPEPEPTKQDRYEVSFFVRGIRHLPDTTTQVISKLQVGERLYIAKDVQNSHDSHALLLRTDKPVSLVGYAPRYYSEDFSLIASGGDVAEAIVTVEQVNLEAPLPYRLLCKISAPWPSSFSPCESSKFSSLASVHPPQKLD